MQAILPENAACLMQKRSSTPVSMDLHPLETYIEQSKPR
jgi:hypothetical protein